MPHAAGNSGGQKQTLDLLGLMLHVIVTNTVWVLEVNDGSSWRAAKTLNLEVPSFSKLIIWELASYINNCIYLYLSFGVTITWRLNEYFLFVINDFPK